MSTLLKEVKDGVRVIGESVRRIASPFAPSHSASRPNSYYEVLKLAASIEPIDDGKKAEILDIHNPRHRQWVAEMMMEGLVIAFPFNGIYGIFADLDNAATSEGILEAKARPRDRMLIQVALPEHLHEVGLVREPYSHRKLAQVLQEVHALGVIMHPANGVPEDLIDRRVATPTVLPIWTEEPNLRDTMLRFRKLGGRAWRGSSLNKSGGATHWRGDRAVEEFIFDVAAIVIDDFTHLPMLRLRSTSIVDLTGSKPRWHRQGNTTKDEIDKVLSRHGFPRLYEERDVIIAQIRQY